MERKEFLEPKKFDWEITKYFCALNILISYSTVTDKITVVDCESIVPCRQSPFDAPPKFPEIRQCCDSHPIHKTLIGGILPHLGYVGHDILLLVAWPGDIGVFDCDSRSQ